jgi:hypothetical protein
MEALPKWHEGSDGPSGFGSGDDVVDEATALKPAFGLGLYSQREDSDHAGHRRLLAAWLSFADKGDWRVVLNALPPKSTVLIEDWEYVLGLDRAPDSWTLAQRQARLRARCIEIHGASVVNIKAAFEALTGGTCYVYETEPVRAEDSVFEAAVLVPSSAWDKRMWPEVEAMCRRIEPAHGWLNACVTNDGNPTPKPCFYSATSGADAVASLTERDCVEVDVPA